MPKYWILHTVPYRMTSRWLCGTVRIRDFHFPSQANIEDVFVRLSRAKTVLQHYRIHKETL
jgi:hypothetical protein